MLHPYQPQQIDFLKIDVEGSALQVLQGLGDYAWRTKYIAVAAYHKPYENPENIKDLLQQQGFMVSQINYLFSPYIYAWRD
jgi:hypothetical protein